MGPRRSGRLKHLPGSCVSDAPEVSDANKKRVTIDCLPDVLLLQVLASIKSGNGLEYRYRLAEVTCSSWIETSAPCSCRAVLPLVCKRWQCLLQGPSALWEVMVPRQPLFMPTFHKLRLMPCCNVQDVMLDFCDKEKNHQRLLRSAIQGWLKPRASSVKTMTFK